jgi:hypothetical protein
MASRKKGLRFEEVPPTTPGMREFVLVRSSVKGASKEKPHVDAAKRTVPKR